MDYNDKLYRIKKLTQDRAEDKIKEVVVSDEESENDTKK